VRQPNDIQGESRDVSAASGNREAPGRHMLGCDKTRNYDLALGIPCFRKHNSDINWQKGTLQQMRYDCLSEREVQKLYANHHEERARDYTTNQDRLNEPEIREERQVPPGKKRSIKQGQGDQTEESATKRVACPATKATRTLEEMLPKEY